MIFGCLVGEYGHSLMYDMHQRRPACRTMIYLSTDAAFLWIQMMVVQRSRREAPLGLEVITNQGGGLVVEVPIAAK